MKSPEDDQEPRYTLDQLCARVADRVRHAGLAQDNGQVSTLPDGRTLRYYTTLGLMDRPVEIRDRRALYRDVHVDQVMAIKRLQAAGHSLSQIQRLLAGATPAARRAIAEGRRPTTGARRDPSFWTATPEAGTRSDPPTAAVAGAPPAAVVGIGLADGLTALITTPTRPITADDTAALRAAATPLIDELIRRGLLDPHAQETAS